MHEYNAFRSKDPDDLFDRMYTMKFPSTNMYPDACGSRYSRNMYQNGSSENKHNIATYGEAFGYKDFIPMFTAPLFNATEWASIYRRAGARYAGPVAEHADGFAMFRSSVSHYNAQEMGPKRDVVGA